MEYNTQREHLKIPEYGRAVQEMVNYCKSIENREDRNQFAEVIIDKLGLLNPHLRDIPDFKHKLWDHLFIMADYDLEVDSPYPFPTREEMNVAPNRMKYPTILKDHRYYGNVIRNMIETIKDWENDDKKAAITLSIANQMKKSYLMWNKDQVEDSVIFKHLKQLSDGKIVADESIKLIENVERNKSINFKNKRNRKKPKPKQ